MTWHKTICSYCGVGCGLEVSVDPAQRLQVRGDAEYPVNKGMLCSKGKYLHQVVMDQQDRLLYPEMRHSKAHPMARVSWDTALDRVAAVFRSLIRRHGPRSVAFYVSGQCLTEEYYVANKLMKGFIGANNIDTNSRLCMSSAVAGYKLSLGDDACPIGYEDIEKGDCYLIAGANPAWCHPILFRRLEAHKAAWPEAKLIVVDPRRTATCAQADLHLQLRPGTDVTLYNAIARVLIEQGWIDRNFIAFHTEGMKELEAAVLGTPVAEAARVCDVPEEQIVLAAQWIGAAKAFQSWWAMGLNQSAVGVDKNLALLNLSLITGQIGKPGAGPFSLTGQPNAMGGREVGGLSTMLAAHRNLADPSDREWVAKYWKSGPIDPQPGLTATEMMEAIEQGTLKALWVICTNPAVSLPDLNRVTGALVKAPFLVVQDISRLSDTVAYADVLLPAAGWLEKEGTMTNSERRIAYLPKVLDAPGEARPDVEILCDFAGRMGWGEAFTYAGPSEIFDEHARLTAGTHIDITGVNYTRLRQEGSVQWPCPAGAYGGTARLFEDGRFYTPSGKARVHGVAPQGDTEAISRDFPFILTTGRIRDQWHTMTRTGKVSALKQHLDRPYAEINPEDAEQMGVADGQPLRVWNVRGEVVGAAHITDRVKPGVLFMPMHWSKQLRQEGGRANLVTHPAVDPRSKEPDYKFAAVNAAPARASIARIVVVGAGAAARAFVERYREEGGTAAITVLCGEPDAFYNRVQLPGYLEGRLPFGALQTCTAQVLAEWGADLRINTRATRIDREQKRVFDEAGNSHGYDRLVLATGSRAVLPEIAPAPQSGVHTLRSRADGDAIRAACKPGDRVVVSGGGLLGLELCGALTLMGAEVHLVHRSGRLMRQQLDETASQLLLSELRLRGIHVHLHESIQTLAGTPALCGVRLRSGQYVPCTMLCFAVGIAPDKQLAMEAGLRCDRGVVVNEVLQSSDPAIHAIGEVAELHGHVYGTTPAAEAQARVAAACLAGKSTGGYAGSPAFNVLKMSGLQLCAMGKLEEPGGADTEEIVFRDLSQGLYKRITVRKNRVTGAILYGDLSEMALLRQCIEGEEELDARRRALLNFGGSAHAPCEGALVCACNNVGRGNIERVIHNGEYDFDRVCSLSRAGTGCGSCRPEVRALLETHTAVLAGR
ncbi:MAG: molybdopterin-dependent oxidoreductase [Candidatus Hydrogenedentes bacterium]|nr:molybdopterin-dependent oxidoreductase [Candidatus Hydrogenedentota bacterium]